MKYNFFDLDHTVTASRQKISPEMKDKLSTFDNVIIVSGASRLQMEYQLDGLKCEIMAQNGNDTSLWNRKLNKQQKNDILNHLSYFTEIGEDRLEDRGCQISYSFVGHHADPEIKKTFDPNGEKRRELLKKYPFKSRTVEIKIGGTTCLDYFPKGYNKGKNIEDYLKARRWKKKDCVYYGDALFEGGNDESVLGIIKCIKVEDPEDLLKKL